MIESVFFYCGKCKETRTYEPEKKIFSLNIQDAVCEQCNSAGKIIHYNYANAVTIYLKDAERLDETNELPVYLFNKDTENVGIGYNVVVDGEIFIEGQNGSDKGRLFSFFYANSIKYENREEIILNPHDIEEIEKFREEIGQKNLISKLVKMSDPSLIGHENVKEGILLAAVNTGSIHDKKIEFNLKNTIKRQRINTLLIGDPGEAKSSFARWSATLVKNSRYESAQNSSGKSLTAIVSKEGDTPIVRLGPVPLARHAICALNEIGGMSFEEQTHLLDAMEEGFFTFNKYGINGTIYSPTTFILTANPISTKWSHTDQISNDEFPLLKTVIDRSDQIFIFKSTTDDEELREYAKQKAKQEDKELPDNTEFIIKYIEYAKQFEPVFTDEAKFMLSEYYVSVGSTGFGTKRLRDSLFRLAKARARLKLKEFVDAEDAEETMRFYNMVLKQYQKIAPIITNPRDRTYNTCVSFLQELKVGIVVEELFKQVCEKDEQVKAYLLHSNPSLQLSHNRQVKEICKMLQNHSNIKVMRQKPLVLQWFDDNDKSENSKTDVYDTYDTYDKNNTGTEKETTLTKQDVPSTEMTENKEINQMSYTSHTSYTKFYPCDWCPKVFPTKEEKVSHSINNHKGKPADPDPPLLKLVKESV